MQPSDHTPPKPPPISPPNIERDRAAPIRPRVLIAEDDAIIGMLLAETLTEMGYDVCSVAPTELAAVIDAKRHSPDLLIVDAALRGGGSGVRAVAAITSLRRVPHVFVTGDVGKLRAQRPDAIVVQKPFRDSELAAAIKIAFATNIRN